MRILIIADKDCMMFAIQIAKEMQLTAGSSITITTPEDADDVIEMADRFDYTLRNPSLENLLTLVNRGLPLC
jgi:hypothetical protein